MDWTRHVDGYCERIDPSFWAEPVNAITNAAFLVAALVMARRLRGNHLPLAWALVGLVALIGIGSFLFHTYAQPWAGAADVIPIVLFILVYIFAASRDFLGLSTLWSLGVVLAFLPTAALLIPVMRMVPILGVSAGYLPVPLMILIYAALLRGQPALSRGLAIGAGLLLVSLTFRSLDMRLCAAVPLGTHFAWHILNGIMLGWMIEVYRRHAGRPGLARAAGQS
ncbi:MAG: ceramidase domain-containing protein [Pseudomonadota bacterium]